MTLEDVRRIALALPEANEAPHFYMTSFRIRGKIFATVPPGEEFLHVFVDEAERIAAIEKFPDFIESLFWGKKVGGVRVLLPVAKPEVVRTLLAKAWARKAPKKLLSR